MSDTESSSTSILVAQRNEEDSENEKIHKITLNNISK